MLDAGAATLVDVRRFPASRRHPQFNRGPLADGLAEAGIGYVHAVELGGRRDAEVGEERFDCIGLSAFRRYAARMTRSEWQTALAAALAEPVPCFLCAETSWTRCHRRLIADQLQARSHRIIHLLGPTRREPHELSPAATIDDGRLYLCGELVA